MRRRILIGTYVLSAGYYDAYYTRAQKVRALILRDFTEAFGQVDALLTPTAPSAAFAQGEKMDDPVTMYLNDVFTVPANLAGVPGLSVPAGLDPAGLPLGLQVLGRPFDEETVFAVGARDRARGRVYGVAGVAGGGGMMGAEGRPNGMGMTAKGKTQPGAQAHIEDFKGPAFDGVKGQRPLPFVPARRRRPAMTYTIEGSTGPWEIVVGLEVHAQVTSRAKLFSGAATDFGAEPNSQVSFVDAAFPGMLPVINRECVAQAVRTGLGLDAHINLVSRFDRKNYFYADLPAGYQISQLYHPIVGAGTIEIELDGGTKQIGVTRLHLEQDAGKSLHDQDPTRSYIDLNRAGVALMEIVSEPDMRSPEEAGAYLRKLRTILRYLGTCDGNMEEGRCARTSTSPSARPASRFRTRCEGEERQLHPLRHAGRGGSRPGGRWRCGSPAARWTRRRGSTTAAAAPPAACAARRTPRLPLLPRPRPAAAGVGRGVGGGSAQPSAGTAGRQAGALRSAIRPVAVRRRGAGGRAGDGGVFRKPSRAAGTPRQRRTT